MFEFIIAAFSGTFVPFCIAFYSGTLFEYVLESNHREISRNLSNLNYKMDEELVKLNNNRFDQMNKLREIEIEQRRIFTILTRNNFSYE
jgi:hypothetical protein